MELSNGTSIKIPKGFIIHNTSLIEYQRISGILYINDLDDLLTADEKEVTIKLKINVPHALPNLFKRFFTEITAEPYFKCECLMNNKTSIVVIYTKERFEKNNKVWEEYKKRGASSLPDGKYGIIKLFCPYYGTCNSDFPEKIYLSKEGKEISQMEMDMMQVKKMIA